MTIDVKVGLDTTQMTTGAKQGVEAAKALGGAMLNLGQSTDIFYGKATKALTVSRPGGELVSNFVALTGAVSRADYVMTAMSSTRVAINLARVVTYLRNIADETVTVTKTAEGMTNSAVGAVSRFQALFAVLKAHPMFAVAAGFAAVTTALAIFTSRSAKATEATRDMAIEMSNLANQIEVATKFGDEFFAKGVAQKKYDILFKAAQDWNRNNPDVTSGFQSFTAGGNQSLTEVSSQRTLRDFYKRVLGGDNGFVTLPQLVEAYRSIYVKNQSDQYFEHFTGQKLDPSTAFTQLTSTREGINKFADTTSVSGADVFDLLNSLAQPELSTIRADRESKDSVSSRERNDRTFTYPPLYRGYSPMYPWDAAQQARFDGRDIYSGLFPKPLVYRDENQVYDDNARIAKIAEELAKAQQEAAISRINPVWHATVPLAPGLQPWSPYDARLSADMGGRSLFPELNLKSAGEQNYVRISEKQQYYVDQENDDRMKKAADQMRRAGRDFGEYIGDAASDLVLKTKTAGDVLRSAVSDITRSLLRQQGGQIGSIIGGWFGDSAGAGSKSSSSASTSTTPTASDSWWGTAE